MRKLLFVVPLLAILFIAFVPLSLSQNVPVTIFSQSEWCHVSVGGVAVESVAWTRFGDDVQITFFAFNQSNLSYDQFIISANKTFSDPLGKFDVFWTGEITVEEKIVLAFSSVYGQISTVVEPFTGEVPHWGRPNMEYTKSVITVQNKIYDVVADEVHVASFEWSLVTWTTNETEGTNQTVPQLTVYNPDGSKFDMRAMTTSYVPIIEYYDKVGWMMDTLSSNYVKWILYSGDAFQVRTSQGFGTMPLPFFTVYPASLRVNPRETVTIQFSLPEGVTIYDASWTDTIFSQYIEMNSNPVFNSQTQQYEVSFKFLESAENRRFTIRVIAEKYGVTYEGSASVTVLPPLWKSLLLPIGVFVIFIVCVFFGVFYLWRSRKEPIPVPKAFQD